MSGFFSKTHELVPEPISDQYNYCKGSINNISFSGLQNFESCPYHLYLDKVKQIPRSSNTASNRGNAVHDMLEQYVNGTLDETEMNWTLLKSGSFHKQLIDTFRTDYEKGLVIPELKYAITKKLKSCDWDSPKLFHRGAIDVVLFKDSRKKQAMIWDYKTGMMNKSVVHRSQLMLYSLMLFILYPRLNDISCSPIYLDHKTKPFYTTFVRSDLSLFLPRWITRFNQVTDATVFPARPNQFSCKWCPHKATRTDIGQVEPACEWGVF